MEWQVKVASYEVMAHFFHEYMKGDKHEGTSNLLFYTVSRFIDNLRITIWLHREKNIKRDHYAILSVFFPLSPRQCFSSTALSMLAFVSERSISEKNAQVSFFMDPNAFGFGYLFHLQVRP